MQKWEMREVFARKMRGVFAPSSSTFAPSSPTFAKKSRLAKSNANLIGYEQTTHVRSRSSMVKKQRRCSSQANVVKKIILPQNRKHCYVSLSMVRFSERRKEVASCPGWKMIKRRMIEWIVRDWDNLGLEWDDVEVVTTYTLDNIDLCTSSFGSVQSHPYPNRIIRRHI